MRTCFGLSFLMVVMVNLCMPIAEDIDKRIESRVKQAQEDQQLWSDVWQTVVSLRTINRSNDDMISNLNKRVAELEAEVKRLRDGTVVPPPVDEYSPIDAELPSRLYEANDHIWFVDAQSLPVHPDNDRWLNKGISLNLPTGEFNAGPTIYPGIKVDTGELGKTYQDGSKPPITMGSAINVYLMSTSSQWQRPDFGVATFDQFPDWNEGYQAESYQGAQPFGKGHRVQNVPPGLEADERYSQMDRHSFSIVVDSGLRPVELYESYRTWKDRGKWRVANAARFDLRGPQQYDLWPRNWTSSNAAGTQFSQLIVRRSEAQAGEIRHMLAMTVGRSAPRFIWPATHHAGNFANPDVVPMGAIVRSKITADALQRRIKNYNLTPAQRAIVNALYVHGALIMDNGIRGWIAADEGVMTATEANILAEHFRTSELVFVDASVAKVSDSSSRIFSKFVAN